ncbi:phenylacetate--CoA ligase family protein [Leptospira ognonensis]|uniref:Phenylacetate--CoA ligase family protein n=1 Tax=Leptospira ognonensis TaxID=2484945 RepID=A0A4R9K7B1_9LEPT|nr:phenylacetate--CoA ligase family protein [Leptospira ognonensis]TGL62199.1 phenylacetate--CoA ligase family protein [Leptospira ognonensis]
MKKEWYHSLTKMIESQYAPRWNTIIGDRITEADYENVKSFETELYTKREFLDSKPKESILDYVGNLRFYSNFFYERLKGLSIRHDFERIPRMTRDDLQNKMTQILPPTHPLDRIIVNPTSGTTGKPILAPNHPFAIGCYVPMIEYSLLKYNVKVSHDFQTTAAIQLCHQNKTIVYATTHSLAGGAKFAKINWKDQDWRELDHKEKFLYEQAPTFLSGDPYAFEEAMKSGLNYKPKALHSTALELEESLRISLATHFQCPVINFYSLNETGPIAYACPLNPEWLHILPHDIFVETLDEYEQPSSFGEIVITGGRNPFLPLLRYATGDFGELNFSLCTCGEKTPRLKLLKGRKPIYFTDVSGKKINPVDISRILRMDPNVLRHQFIQKKNGTYEMNLSFLNSPSQIEVENLETQFQELLGKTAEVKIKDNLPNDQRKISIFINENLEK